MARHRLPATVVFAAAAACVALAGCASTPPGGAPRAVSGPSTQVQAYVLPEPPPPPTSNIRLWTPSAVVLGFLHASASFAIDPAAARAYLVPQLRKHWDPSAVTVVGAPHDVTQAPYPFALQPAASQQPIQYRRVYFTGQKLATLGLSGQYQYASGNPRYVFTLALVNGVWLIYQLPQGGRVLLLTQSDFEDVYQPRNLYFFAPNGTPYPQLLVPEPVYAPVEGSDTALNTTVAAHLVTGLFKDNSGWLAGATLTEFPAGTTLRSLSITDQIAVVNLGGAAARAQQQQIIEMAEQLKATLTTASGYSPPVARAVDLEINGKLKYTGDLPADSVPPVSAAGPEPAFYIDDQGGGVAELLPRHKVPVQVVSAPQIDFATATAVAAQPDGGQQVAVAVSHYAGCAVYIGDLGSKTAYRIHYLSRKGGPCTSLSWDSNGNLWVAAGKRIWLVPAGPHPLAVSPPDIPGTSSANYSILDLCVAPDAVRVALLVQTTAGTREVLLAAVTVHGASASFGPAVVAGTGLFHPAAIAWYNPYYLVALAGLAINQVPLTGGTGQQLEPAPTGAETLTTDGTHFLVGTTQAQIVTATASAPNWARAAAGADPIYPG